MNRRKLIKKLRHQKSIQRRSYRRQRKHKEFKYKPSEQENPSFKNKIEGLGIVLEYRDLFNGKDERVDKLLRLIPRELSIKIIGTLVNLYSGTDIQNLNNFFSRQSINNRALITKFLEKYYLKHPKQDNLILMSPATSIRLLRHIYALPPTKGIMAITEEQAEWIIFKAVLLVNQELMQFNIPKSQRNYQTMAFILSVLNRDMHIDDNLSRKSRTIMQLWFATRFFEYIEKQRDDSDYRKLYNAFLKEHNAKHWHEYVRSIYGTLIMTGYRAAIFDKTLSKDETGLISKEVLNSLTIPYDEQIPYCSGNVQDRDGNTDYKRFREKPLIRMSDGSYFIYNWEFMIDSLYNSLYFEFKELNRCSSLSVDVDNLFTEKFVEKTLLSELITSACSTKRYECKSENLQKHTYKPKQNELGPVDFILKGEKSTILIECKDIRIRGDVLESHSYNAILDVLRNKLYKKEWKYEGGKKSYLPEEKKRRIGITQLTDHISNIRNGGFRYDQINKDHILYPVLILSDPKNLYAGFTYISNVWYKDALNKLNLTPSRINRPLIVMSFITLIKYNQLFYENGFEHYFECYFKEMACGFNDNTFSLENAKTFDAFMESYPFQLNDFSEKILSIFMNDN